MKVFYTLFLALLCLLPLAGFAQRNCSTMDVLERLQTEDPALAQRMEAIERQTEAYLESGAVQSRTVVTIPVVVHVVYRTGTENISDAQIQSQIDVLNNDFQALNSDLGLTPALFQNLVGNVEVEFCLAKQDPNGNPTTGIDRKQTTRSSWSTSDRVKKSAQGGVNPWVASKYLNLWICNIGGGILGYAQFPGGSATTDGVVLDYRYVGTIGTATSPFNKGRTATHEIGHWLNLRHIWGDATCGSDQVSDTPTHNAANYGCPSYPHNSTCTGTPVEMTMNFMDYSDDRCMYMFSAGQVARMRAVLTAGGARAGLLSSNGCVPPGGGGTTCAIPSGLNASNITTSSATLTWGAVSGATSYNIQIRPIGNGSWSNYTSNTTSYSASSLSSGTAYEFQVQTVCGGSTSADYAAANFTTDQEAPPGCTDNYENNNTKAKAKAIAVGIPIQALINTDGDVDWFKFTISSPYRNIRVSLSDLAADYDLKLYRNNAVVGTSEEEGTADEQVVYNNGSTSATYYIKVYGYNGSYDAANCYSLYVETSTSGYRNRTDGKEGQIEGVTEEFLLFPNPASDAITLDIPVTAETPTQISIFDLSGKLVKTASADLTKGNTITKVNTSELSAGMYVIRVQNGNYTSTRKFVINR